jgi:hypothetical protein
MAHAESEQDFAPDDLVSDGYQPVVLLHPIPNHCSFDYSSHTAGHRHVLCVPAACLLSADAANYKSKVKAKMGHSSTFPLQKEVSNAALANGSVFTNTYMGPGAACMCSEHPSPSSLHGDPRNHTASLAA